MDRISILGAGKVGSTLGRVFFRAGHQIGDIASRRRSAAERARGLIGTGRVVDRVQEFDRAAILIVAISDDALPEIAADLMASPAVQADTIVFHCSGATASSVLAPLRNRGARIASVHPVKTFTDPVRDAETFAGTWCGMEGDPAATQALTRLFEGVGAHPFPIAIDQKLVYHAAGVFLCNYLIPLIEAGLQCYERAGVPREIAVEAVKPLLSATVENTLADGPPRALTGPIARGDHRVVADQLRSLEQADPKLAELYRLLGLRATDLAQQKQAASAEQIAAIKKVLRGQVSGALGVGPEGQAAADDADPPTGNKLTTNAP